MSLSTGALDRAVRAGSYRNVLDLDARRAALGYDKLQEIEHQFQIAIEGTATPNLTWSYFDLPFDVEFFFLPQQRDSPLVVPHFTYGQTITGDISSTDANESADRAVNPYGQVGVLANVVGWAQDARDAITGARVGVGVFCGGYSTATTVDFDGFVHMTFSGFGAPGGANAGDNSTALNVGT